ncbi:MAG: hypothetical protein K2G37_00245, partial [Clostridia bacterium]|nr:hypothetical protein [Clostridia bacterium]
MKKKILLLTVTVVLILSMSMALLAGCGGDPVEFGEQTIGTEAPSNVAYSVEDGMSAFEMLEVGVKNYYDADVAVMSYKGSVVTTILGGIKVTQNVISNKIRVGKGDEGGNNANKAKYFADNQSYGYTSLYEKMIIDGNSVTYKNSSSQKYDEDNGTWKKVKWNSDEKYDSVAALEKEKNNNPTI